MPVTLIITRPRRQFPRSYVKGFVGSSDVTNLTIVGQDVTFDYLFPLIQVVLHINSKFFPPTSNVYSLDHVFDASLSQVYLSGVPIAGGVGVALVSMTTEPTWRVQVLATLSINEAVKVDLTPVSNYWRLPV